MFCSNCGNKMEDGVRFCSQCGAAVTPPVSEEPKTEAPAVEAPKVQMPDWMHDNWVPEMPVIEAPAPKGRKKKEAPSAQASASPTVPPEDPFAVPPADPFAVPPADPFAVPSREQETKKPKKAKKKRTGLRVVAALLIVAILAGIGGWVLFSHETVYLVTEVRKFSPEGVNTLTATYTYDAKGNVLEQITDEAEDGQKVDGVADCTVTYTYDKEGKLIQSKTLFDSGEEYFSEYTYKQSDDRINRIELSRGLTSSPSGKKFEIVHTVRYDSKDRISKIIQTLEDGTTQVNMEFRYDNTGRITTYIYNHTKFEYQYQAGRLKKMIRYGKDRETGKWGEKNATCRYTYDFFGRLLEVKSTGLEDNIICEYDRKGNLCNVCINETEYEFAYQGRRIVSGSIYTSDGKETELEYDQHGNLIRKTYPDGSYYIAEYESKRLSKADAARYYRCVYASGLDYGFSMSEVNPVQTIGARSIYPSYLDILVSLPENPAWEFKRLCYIRG